MSKFKTAEEIEIELFNAQNNEPRIVHDRLIKKEYINKEDLYKILNEYFELTPHHAEGLIIELERD
jgi:hypothetical protein